MCSILPLCRAQGLTMGDAFCGMGTVSIAANEVGWQVRALRSSCWIVQQGQERLHHNATAC